MCLIKGGGKEVSVYRCLGNKSAQAKYLAAKVYRPRQFRQLRNDSLYKEGRQHLTDEGLLIKDDRALHAIQKRTKFGQRLLHSSWVAHEFQATQQLFRAGADVPEPFVSANNAILMGYIRWDDLPAPTLNTVQLASDEIRSIFDRIVRNIKLMLDLQIVHGDLSAYNILYKEGNIWLIDFPQVINLNQNRNAYAIFRRDILRLCEYFQSQGLQCDSSRLAEELWISHGYRLNTPVHPSLLEPEVLDEQVTD